MPGFFRIYAVRLLIAFSFVFLWGCTTTPPAPPPGSSTPVPTPPTPPRPASAIESDEAAAQLGLVPVWLVPESRLQMKGSAGSLDLAVGYRETRLNGLKVFLGEPPIMDAGRMMLSRTDLDGLLAPILLGSGVRDRGPVRMVAVDAGHGGHDSGTKNLQLGLQEKDLTLDVAKRLRDALVRRGYQVVMIREDDTFVPLEKRPELARGADLFISIHFNATGNAAVSGTETYVLSRPGQASTGVPLPYDGDTAELPGNRWDAGSASFGFTVQRRLVRAFGTTDRGLKQARFAVLRGLPCPGVLVESAFLSNKAEAMRVGTAPFRNELAQMLAEAVDDYADLAGGGGT